jgi:hypothetical protein
MLETRCEPDEADHMTEAYDEAMLRLAVFGAAMCAIAIRRSVLHGTTNCGVAPLVEMEARLIADAVVAEANRLKLELKK